MQIYTGYGRSPIGIIEIKATDNVLVSVKILNEGIIDNSTTTEASVVIKKTIAQLKKYFEGRLKQFDLPLAFIGTEFQQKVWQELLKIPFGQTITYGQLALRLGSKDLSRAVGNANGKNPLWIIIPCHRVIGCKGELVGYAGGLWRKKWLLEHEGCQKRLFL